jgi:SHS2 domain-containing protein
MPFKFLENIATADFAIEATGKTIEEAFEEAALAMFEIQTNTKKVRPISKKEVKIQSEDKKSLLFDWLSKLLYLRDIEKMFFSKFEVKIEKKNDGFELNADIYGERIDVKEHELKTEVKGVSYTQMEINEKPSKCKIIVIFDV